MGQVGRPASVDLRERVVAAYKTGRFSYASLAEFFGIGPASVSRYLRLHRETGRVEPRPHGGGVRPVLTELDRRRLRSLLERHPDWTTYELRDALNEARQSAVSRSTVVRALAELGYTRKKSPWSPKSGTRRVTSSGEKSSSKRSRRSPPNVLFIWTRPAQPSR